MSRLHALEDEVKREKLKRKEESTTKRVAAKEKAARMAAMRAEIDKARAEEE